MKFKKIGRGLVMAAVMATPALAQEKAQSIFADMENPELRRMAGYQLDISEFCAPINNIDKKREVYSELKRYKWDRKAMGCALQYGGELIDESIWSYFSIEDKLQLLGARAEFFSVLEKLYNAHYQGGELTDELKWRWENNRRSGNNLIEELSVYSSVIGEVQLVSTAFNLASTMRETSTAEMIDISANALQVLSEIVGDDPEMLDGLAITMLGQMLITLPEFSGGDPVRAIELLRKGIELDGNNLTAYRWIIEGFVVEREDDIAREFLQKASEVSPEAIDPQDYADFAKDLGGVAYRLGQPEIAKKFSRSRQALLEQKPYLQKRKEVASVGHGGENPITGELHNEI